MRILYIAVALVFCMCKNQVDFQLQKIDESTFDVGFVANHRFIGITFDRLKSENLIFFGDPTTRKVIKFFAMDGYLEFETTLKEAKDSLGNIQHYEVISPDTIFLFGEYNSKIVVINRHGKVWHSLNLQKSVTPYGNFNLNYVPSIGGHCIKDNVLFLNIEYLSRSKDVPTPSIPGYFSEALDVPYFLKLINIYDSSNLKYEFGLRNFYRRFMTDSTAMGELVRYSVMDKNLIVFSNYSDSIYFVDDQSLEILNVFKISSTNTFIGAKLIKLNNSEEYAKYYETEVKYKGYISKIIYDEVNKLYVVSIACENMYKKPFERDYTYCFYTDKGEKVYEFIHKKDEYIPSLLYINKGIYHMVPRSSTDYLNKNTLNFSRYEVLNY